MTAPDARVSERVREMWILACQAPPDAIDWLVEEAERLVASAPADLDALDHLDALHRVQRLARAPGPRKGG
jgi:hypothetical protein